MEPANATIIYTIETSVVRKFRRADGWFVSFQGIGIAIYLGYEEPQLKGGDRIAIQIRKQDAKDIGTSIEQTSQAPALG